MYPIPHLNQVRKVTDYPYFIHNLELISFIFHSQKSIFTNQKSIIPLFSRVNGCYNAITLRSAKRCFCKLIQEIFHPFRRNDIYL